MDNPFIVNVMGIEGTIFMRCKINLNSPSICRNTDICRLTLK